MLVKTAHRDFPRELLGQKDLERGEWTACTTEKNGIKLQACRFLDLRLEDFISTCSTYILGNPRVTKHHGLISRPKVAETYLKYATSIDIHNHTRSGSRALEDVWKTLNPRRRQLAGILGFCFTNGFLATKYFKENTVQHHEFKMKASYALVNFKEATSCQTRSFLNVSQDEVLHKLQKLQYSVPCFYCQDGYDTPHMINNSTTFKCESCKIAICKPSKGDFWSLHLAHGVPKKCYLKKK